MPSVIKIIGTLILGVTGAFLFQVFMFPWMLTNPYFENFEFIKSFKEGKIVINPTQQVYIQENTALESVVERVEKSLATIQKNNGTVGAGFIATSDGSIVTLFSLVQGGSSFSVFLNGEKENYRLSKTDPKTNLALIKIDKNNLATAGFSDSDKIKLGQRVFLLAANSAKQNDWLANEGIIKTLDGGVIKTNISEKSSASGSPLFNIAGELVGLCYVDQSGQISAIPIGKIKTFLGL